MNPRLIRYLRSIGLDANATDEQTQEFLVGLRGLQSSIANILNYQQDDAQARTNADLLLRALGINPENPTENLTPPTDDDPGTDGASGLGDLEAARAEGVAEYRRRAQEIRQYAELAGAPAEMANQLVDDADLTVEQARERMLAYHRERQRTQVTPDMPDQLPAIHSRNSQTGHTADSLAAALMFRAGVADPTQQWCRMIGDEPVAVRRLNSQENPDVYRAVERGAELREYSLVSICQRALALQGVQAEPTPRGIRQAMRSLTSTGEFVGIFTQTFGAILLQAFTEAPDTTSMWTVERDNPNFMTNERTRLVKGGELTKHARGRTADHMDFSDITESVKVNRYSGQFVVDEIDLVNDYFGALAGQQPQEIGRAAARIRPDLVYSILFANPALASGTNLFDAAHNNLLTTNALDIDGLQNALTAMQLQQENGVNLNLNAAYLLVPPALQYTAFELLNATIVVTGSDIVRPNVNALGSVGVTPISEPRLENGVVDPNTGTTHAGSSTSWYLTAEPGSGHTIEVTYLAGSARSPQMRSFVLDRGQWGIGWDVKHDIGAAPLAYQGMNKSTA